jgi:hypothetical protein
MICIHCDVCGDDITDDTVWHTHHNHGDQRDCGCLTYCARCCPQCREAS